MKPIQRGFETKYWLDQKFRIIHTCSNWDMFAIKNEGFGAVSTIVTGTPLLDFIIGNHTRLWMKNLLEKSFDSFVPIVKPYRCDAPEEKRYMEMTLQNTGEKILEITHKIVETRKIDPHVGCQYSLDTHKRRLRCSICNRILLNEHWMDVELAYADGLVAKPPVPVSYGICEECQ